MSSRQANQASIRKDTQVRLAELKGVALNTIPYSRSNAILTQYQEEIRNLEKKTNYQSEIDSIDKLADWLARPEKEDPVRHIDGSITWFSRRISKLALQKKLNNHGIEY
ncbi:12865_t:CDS:2 [Ambispora leptoticha]|uniref:12865_t:CDS:1 n=1 Tax=Ambispora leptoticha TaxID=144679 RepID=A0A9N9FZ06_9GLOM|nr:12865_t:CDS:2 [Ambispora leptoticha]